MGQLKIRFSGQIDTPGWAVKEVVMGLLETHTQGRSAKRGSRYVALCSELVIDLQLHIDQTDGGVGLAEICLENVPPHCVNCTVYEWKQVKDSRTFLHFYFVSIY